MFNYQLDFHHFKKSRAFNAHVLIIKRRALENIACTLVLTLFIFIPVLSSQQARQVARIDVNDDHELNMQDISHSNSQSRRET
jgi:hypothetical protein